MTALGDPRQLFTSLDIARTLMRIFPQELLRKIPQKFKDQFYDREWEFYAHGPAA